MWKIENQCSCVATYIFMKKEASKYLLIKVHVESTLVPHKIIMGYFT